MMCMMIEADGADAQTRSKPSSRALERGNLPIRQTVSRTKETWITSASIVSHISVGIREKADSCLASDMVQVKAW